MSKRVIMPATKSPRPVLLVAGARPNFMKIAPIVRELTRRAHPFAWVHTGQHYDTQLTDAIFRDLCLPAAGYHLGVGSGTHALQTARVIEAFEPVLKKACPRWLVLVGDVNSTLACAIVAAKLKDEVQCQIAHVEAGLRSRDWRMPEEINRVVTDRLSDVLFTPSRDAHANLAAEGIPAERVVFAGNVMVDTLLAHLPRAREARKQNHTGQAEREYALVTIHRPSNVDDPEALRIILDALNVVAQKMDVVLPLHPRTQDNIARFGLSHLLEALQPSPPLAYSDLLGVTDGASVVLTDSGGLQEETTVLGVPCVTLRKQTERPVTVTEGTNALAPWPLSVRGIVEALEDAARRGRVAVGARSPEGWDGKASERIVDYLIAHDADDPVVSGAIDA